MKNLLRAWRYYTLGREQYSQCMRNVFLNNLYSLRQTNIAIAILAFCFMLFPILAEKNISKAGIYLITVIAAIMIAIFSNRRYKQFVQGKPVSSVNVYILTTAYYANIILFGIYLGVWANPGKLAVCFMIFLICAFFLLINPPLYNLLLTVLAMAVFVVSSVVVKESGNWMFDIVNVLIAGSVSLLFGWQVTMLRMVSALNASKLEEERNSYYDQSTIDELTRLKNRRDFMQTFQRRLTNYRSMEDWLCLAIMDIDYFKNYNDHYGHPAGDECLRAIGTVLNSLGDMGVYAARVGGEEFALIWYEQETADTAATIARIQRMINDLSILHEKSKVAAHVTVSIGIYTMRCGASDDVHALYDLADKALYTAKRNGRNRAIVHSSQEVPDPVAVTNSAAVTLSSIQKISAVANVVDV